MNWLSDLDQMTVYGTEADMDLPGDYLRVFIPVFRWEDLDSRILHFDLDCSGRAGGFISPEFPRAKACEAHLLLSRDHERIIGLWIYLFP